MNRNLHFHVFDMTIEEGAIAEKHVNYTGQLRFK